MTLLASRKIALLGLLALGAGPAGAQGHAPGSARSRWGANYFPNVPLVTQDGEEVRFFDDLIDGKIVAINFIYTSCPDSCPLETARLLEVQGILGDRVGKDVFFYSITIDPEVDTPEVLKKYADRFQVGPGWTFLTGKEEDITLLRRRLGLYIDEIQAEDSNDHNLSLIIGNQATGRWMKRSPFENPYVLAAQIGKWLANWSEPDERNEYEDAPKLRTITKAETTFRTRCSVCHTIGPGDGIFRAGPNLLGVTERRERAWLERWLAAPDEVLASGDPIATELYESYNRVAMPNLKLSEHEIDYLIEYLDSESRRVRASLGIQDIEELEAIEAEGEIGSCCQKKDQIVIGAADEERPSEEEELDAASPAGPPTWTSRMSLASWISVGLGVALGAASAALRLAAR